MTTGSGSTASRWGTVASVALACYVGQSFARFSFGLLLPAMRADLHISYGLAGWLGTINLVGYLIGTVATSIASIRIPPHRLLQFGVVMATAGIITLASTTNTTLLLIGMLMGGIGGAAAWVPAPAIAASVFPAERRGLAMGITSGSIGTGIVIAVLLTNLVRALQDQPAAWRPVWWLEAATGVLAIGASFLWLRTSLHGNGVPPALNALRAVPRWWSPTFAYACFGFGYVLFATFVVAGLQQQRGFGPTLSTVVFAAFGLGNLSGALTVGRWSDRFGRRVAMISSYALCAVACVAVIAGPRTAALPFSFAFGFGMAGAVVSLAAHIGDHVQPQSFGAAFGAATAVFGVAQAIGPRTGGWLIDQGWSFTNLFALASSVWLAGALLASLMPRHR